MRVTFFKVSLNLNISIDLQSAFTWNTKQVRDEPNFLTSNNYQLAKLKVYVNELIFLKIEHSPDILSNCINPPWGFFLLVTYL